MRRLTTACVLVMLASGCGSQASIEPRASRDLQATMTQIRAAVDAGDRLRARLSVRDLERQVAALRQQGLVSQDRAAQILVAAEAVLGQLTLLPAVAPSPSPSPSPTTTTTTAPATPDAGQGGSHGQGHAYGHDEGHGND